MFEHGGYFPIETQPFDVPVERGEYVFTIAMTHSISNR
ncbi:hypothetical protein QE359_003679 [Curtobacterium sp. SORGH_AS776]|nr:hypothetical protein [Curtobacterium sp. SORGH_AS_0776]